MSSGYSLIRLRPMSWYICVIIGLRLAQGSKTVCSLRTCKSENYEEAECELNDGVMIFNATVLYKSSDSNCTYQEGLPGEYNGTDGVFGYSKNILWVDNGCGATFRFCYKESYTICRRFQCESEHNEEVECELDDDVSIIIATVLDRRSDSNCTYQEGLLGEYNGTDGIFGYTKNILWVDNGCRASFNICYTDSETMTSSSSSPVSTVSTIDLSSSTYSSSISTTFSTTTTDPHQDTTSENMTMTTTDLHKNNTQAPERHEDYVVIIVVPVILVIIVLLGIIGILLWRQRRKRNKKIGKQSSKTEDGTSHDKTIHGYTNAMHAKGSLGEGNKNVSANTEQKLNYYNEILLGKTLPGEDENNINENKEQRSNEMCNPLPQKNSNRENDTKAGSEKQKHLPKNHPASEKHAYINVEQEAHDDYYLTPVSKKDHSSEADNCVNLQPEKQPIDALPNNKRNNDYKATAEDHIYDDMDT